MKLKRKLWNGSLSLSYRNVGSWGQKNSRCAPLAPGFTKWALDRKLHTGLTRVFHILENGKINTSEVWIFGIFKFFGAKIQSVFWAMKCFWRKNSKLQLLIIHEFQDRNLNFRAKNGVGNFCEKICRKKIFQKKRRGFDS